MDFLLAFLERHWRSGGIIFAVLYIVAYLTYGSQPGVGASASDLVSYYHGNSTRILIAGFILSFGVLYLVWFASALSSVIRDRGQGTWATTATAASASFAAVTWLLVVLRSALAYSIVDSGNSQFASGLNDLSWALMVTAAIPAAMLIMSGSFGLWFARLISTAAFAPGFAAIWLELAGGTTWMHGGIWAADGAYSHFFAPLLLVAWAVVVSSFLFVLSPSNAPARQRAVVSAQ
ncbi:MAG TPA: hypothetical protein VG104_08020 [Candidatus Dormibacteraeota bacterium]|jgi:hypothetical protein|nr:hypothetical protein [Candidatus Dormibacteraeota bacterium]